MQHFFADAVGIAARQLDARCPRDCIELVRQRLAPLALWRTEADKADIAFAVQYLGLNDREGFNRGIIRGGMSSVAKLFVAQMQDWLDLGAGHRMNIPGTSRGNWEWRMLPGEASKKLAGQIREMTRIYGRS